MALKVIKKEMGTVIHCWLPQVLWYMVIGERIYFVIGFLCDMGKVTLLHLTFLVVCL